MKSVLTAAEIRAAEAEYIAANPSVDLMGRAAEHIANAALEMLGENRQVLVVAGPGNNGGDALFAAAAIAKTGRRVRLWLAFERAHPAGLGAAQAAGCMTLSASNALERLPMVDLVIDGLTGIGGRAGLDSHVSTFAAACRMHKVPVLSIDIPSGLDADSHQAADCFQATKTVTFAAKKLCHVARPAAQYCGDVVVADIGIVIPDASCWQVEISDLRRWWPKPDVMCDKYSRGVVGFDTGSDTYPGAAALGVLGALNTGVGMVRYFGDQPTTVLAVAPSVVCVSGRVQASVLGSGWADCDDDRLRAAASHGVPLVVDAQGLQSLPIDLPAGSVLTPHAGELAQALDINRSQVEEDPLFWVRKAAADFGVCVLLKGPSQYVATPQGQVLIALPGPAWSAQAGSGDVLAGSCGALLATGVSSERAAVMAASVQALAAAANPGPYPPDVIATKFPAVIASLD